MWMFSLLVSKYSPSPAVDFLFSPLTDIGLCSFLSDADTTSGPFQLKFNTEHSSAHSIKIFYIKDISVLCIKLLYLEQEQ